MEITEVIKEIKNRKKTGNLIKKRFTCIHCGKTWIEFVGVIVGRKDGCEDMCLRIGMESENCFACRWRSLKCENCNTDDVYEITFPKDIPEETALSFKSIKKVANHSAHTN
ncbi:MAG: hypothetical protein CW691_03845 [Candidatus Bathyarchaeum sp.]|nr:MAG: hypothetical protein CW691_03845 [Candidatus Bathyarchaeum sp.]